MAAMHHARPIAFLFISSLLTCWLAGRAQAQTTPHSFDANAAIENGSYRWAAGLSGASGAITIVVNIGRQQLYVYQDDRLIGQSTISSGTQGHATPLGEFSILQKNKWHRSNLYSNAPMPFMQRLTWDGIAIHAGHLPGFPASHGCIRLPRAFAERLFAMTKLGVPVSVKAQFGAPPVLLRITPLDWQPAQGTRLSRNADASWDMVPTYALVPPSKQRAPKRRNGANRPRLPQL